MRKLFVVRYQVGNVDVAIILLDQYILADLISVAILRSMVHKMAKYRLPVDKDVVKAKFQDEIPELLLNLNARVIAGIWIRCKHAQRIRSLRVHGGLRLRTVYSTRTSTSTGLGTKHGTHKHWKVAMMP